MASLKKGSFSAFGEAEVVVFEVLEECLRLYREYSKTGIMSTISRIQTFLLTPFSIAPLPYPFSDPFPQIPGILSPQNVHLPFITLLSNRKIFIRFIKHLPQSGQ